MLDENNSLLTAVSEEEAATVCGGKGIKYTVNPDGSVTVISSQTGLVLGTNVTVDSVFTLGGVASPSPVSLEDTTPASSTPTEPNSAYINLTGLTFPS